MSSILVEQLSKREADEYVWEAGTDEAPIAVMTTNLATAGEARSAEVHKRRVARVGGPSLSASPLPTHNDLRQR